MVKARIKQLMWMVGGILLIAIGVTAFVSLSDLLARSQAGADPASALNLAPPVPVDVVATLEWVPDAADTGRIMEPHTRRQIEAAYLRAWAQWNTALAQGKQAGLATYFSGTSLQAVEETVETAATVALRVEQQNRGHTLHLQLYSADGSVVAFTDSPVSVEQRVSTESGTVILTEQLEFAYEVIMFLEDGNWRIRHWVRRTEERDADGYQTVPPRTPDVAE